jgi:hypothetical protein
MSSVSAWSVLVPVKISLWLETCTKIMVSNVEQSSQIYGFESLST